MLQDLEGYLATNHVPYTHTTHRTAYTARDLAAVEHVPAHQIAKTVMFQDAAGPLMAVIPGNCHVDIPRLRQLLGRPLLRLTTEPELEKLVPDCEIGAMAPFGNLCGIPVIVDSDLTDEEFIEFNAGTHRDVVRMRYADFEQLVKPKVMAFSQPQGERGDRWYDF
jgi:Ala-tRNA(Pro) deacylase